MYDLFKKYDDNFSIDFDEIVMDNVYLISKIPTNIIPTLKPETIDYVVSVNDLSMSLEVLLKYKYHFTVDQYETLLSKKYMSNALYQAITDRILSSFDRIEILSNIIKSNSYKIRDYFCDYINSDDLNKFIMIIPNKVLFESEIFMNLISRSSEISKNTFKYENLAFELVDYLIENKSLTKISHASKLWTIDFSNNTALMDNYQFVYKYVSYASSELLYQETQNEDQVDYHFMEKLKLNHPKIYDLLLKNDRDIDMISNYIAQETYGKSDGMSDENLIEMLVDNIDIVDGDESDLKRRVLESPNIMKSLLEREIFPVWFFHHRKTNKEVRNLLADYYINRNTDSWRNRHETSFITRIFIEDYFNSEYIRTSLNDFLKNDANRERFMGDISKHNEDELKVLLTAYPDAIYELGDLKDLYLKYLQFYAHNNSVE